MKPVMLRFTPFPCPLAAHVDVAIVRVPHEAVFAPLQLPIQFRRAQGSTAVVKWTALRRALIHRTYQPVSITPAVRNARISLSILLSAIRRPTAAISLSC